MTIIVCVQGTCLTENSYEHNIIPYQFFTQVAAHTQGVHHLLPLYSGPGGFFGVLKGEGSHGYKANKARIQQDIAQVITDHGPQERLVLYGHSRGGLVFAELAAWMAEEHPHVRIDIITSDLAAGLGGYPGPLAVGNNVVSWVNIRPDCTVPFSRQRLQACLDVDDEGRVSRWSGNLPLENAYHNTCIFANSKEDCKRVMALFVTFWHGLFTPGQPLSEAQANLFQDDVAQVSYYSYGKMAFTKRDCQEIANQITQELPLGCAEASVSQALSSAEDSGVSVLKSIAPARLLERAVANFWPIAVRQNLSRESIQSLVQAQLERVFQQVKVGRQEVYAKTQLQNRLGWMVQYQEGGLLRAQKAQIQDAPQWFAYQGLQELVWTFFDGVQETSGKISWRRLMNVGWPVWLTRETRLPALEVAAVSAPHLLQEAQGDIVVNESLRQKQDKPVLYHVAKL